MDPNGIQQMLRQQQFLNGVNMLSMQYPPEIFNPFLERLQNSPFFQEAFGFSTLPTGHQGNASEGSKAHNCHTESPLAQIPQQELSKNSQKLARDILVQISAYPVFNGDSGPAVSAPQGSSQASPNQGQALAGDMRAMISEYPSPSFVNQGSLKAKGSHLPVHETPEDSQLMARKLKDMVSKYPTYIGQSAPKAQTPIQEMSEDSQLMAKKLKDMISRYPTYLDRNNSKTTNFQLNIDHQLPNHHGSTKLNARTPNVTIQNKTVSTAPLRGPSNPHERPSANAAQLATQVLQRLQSQTISPSQPTPKESSKAKEPPLHLQNQTKATPDSSTKNPAQPAPGSRSQAAKFPEYSNPVETIYKKEKMNKQTTTSSSSKSKLISSADKRVSSIQQVQTPQKTENRVNTSNPVPKKPSTIPKDQATPQKSVQIIKVGTTTPRIELTPPTAIPSNTHKSTPQPESPETQKDSSQSKIEARRVSNIRTSTNTSTIPTAVYDLGNMDRTYIEGVVGFSGSYGSLNGRSINASLRN